MPRCGFAPLRRSPAGLLALAAASLALAGPAAAQAPRNFPGTALRGVIAFDVPPNVRVNGQPMQLAPGVKIHGLDNMLKMSGALAGNQFLVNYTFENPPTGLVAEVWLLRDDEIARQPWPWTPADAAAWSFNPIAQVWTKP
jgi:hypothetical protein